MPMFGRAAAVAFRQRLSPCSARVRMAGRSSVVLPYRGLRGAGRAVRMCTRCAARDNTITITIISTTVTTMALTSFPTCRVLEKMRTWTCLPLRRHHAPVPTISRALLSRDLLGGTTKMLWCGCGCGRANGAMREVLALIRGWTRTQTRMRTRTRTGSGPGGPTRIEYCKPVLSILSLHCVRLKGCCWPWTSVSPMGSFLSF